MKRVLLGAVVATAMLVFAAPAFAATGYVEICKASTGLSGTPSFTYTVSNGGGTVVVPNNSCSGPIAVTPGSVTITETQASFYRVSSITTSPGSALASSNLSTGTATVTVPAAPDSSGAVMVNYTNVPVTGYVEVCKNNAADAGLTGSFTFTVTGNNAFSTTVSVPIGHCSFPILVPAGSVTVTEAAPNSVSSITVQNGAPSTTSTAGGTATVTVKASPAPGDESQEAIVTFFNETVQLKICKIASDSGVNGRTYTFTAVGTDPTFGTVTRSVTITLPATWTVGTPLCAVVPGPYTNPNGTTGWRAGTTVSVSEGPVPGTAVTAISVVPTSAEVGPRVISPLPNPTQPGPAGSDVVALAPGETQVNFTNDTVPGGTLKICESPDAKAPVGTLFTFTVSSFAPSGLNTTASVPAGSCTIVPNPTAGSGGLWPYNAIVDLFQTAIPGLPPVPGGITVSPSARLLVQVPGAAAVSIGSGDVTVATFLNDPSSVSSGGGSSGGGSSGGSSSGGSLGGVPAPSSSSASVVASISGNTSASATQLRSDKMMKLHGLHYLVVHVASSHETARIRIIELNKYGKKIRSFLRTVRTNQAAKVLLPWSAGIKVVVAKLV